MTCNPPPITLDHGTDSALVLFGQLGQPSAVATAIGRGSKALGFAVRPGADFALLRLVLRLSVPEGAQPWVRLFSSQAGQPRHELATLQNPVFDAGLSVGKGVRDCIFLPPRAQALAGGHSYWVVASNSGSTDFAWYGGLPDHGALATAHADTLGRLVSSGHHWVPSSTQNALQVMGRRVGATAPTLDDLTQQATPLPTGEACGMVAPPNRGAPAGGWAGRLARHSGLMDGLARWQHWRTRS